MDLPPVEVPTGHATAELLPALEQGLQSSVRRGCRITGLQRSASMYATSFAIEDLLVTLDDGSTLRVVFKDVAKAALLDSARRVKPGFLYDPLREIQSYRVVLDGQRLGTPTCYATVVDERRGRYWLFLEHVPGVELYQVGELQTWRQVAGWLARMHDGFRVSAPQLVTAHGHLLRYDAEFYRRWGAARPAPPRRRGPGFDGPADGPAP